MFLAGAVLVLTAGAIGRLWLLVVPGALVAVWGMIIASDWRGLGRSYAEKTVARSGDQGFSTEAHMLMDGCAAAVIGVLFIIVGVATIVSL